MTRAFNARTIAAALAAAALLPTSAPAASWTSARAASGAGTAAQPAVALGADGALAVGFTRTIAGERRVEVRRGTVRGLLRGGPVVVDRARGVLAEPALAPAAADGRLPVAWSRFPRGIEQLTGTTIDAAGRFAAPQPLAPPDGHGLAGPAFVRGADGSLMLVWTSETNASGRPVAGGSLGAAFPIPAPGAAAQPKLAVDRDGTTVAVWLSGGRVLAAQAPRGATFGTPAILSHAGRAREPQLVATAAGTVVAAWLRTTGEGNAVEEAVRPRGGAFGAPSTVAPSTQRAFAPRLAATTGGEVLAAWVRTNQTRGFGTASGDLRVQRLAPDAGASGNGAGSPRAASGPWDPCSPPAPPAARSPCGGGRAPGAGSSRPGASRATGRPRRSGRSPATGRSRSPRPRSRARPAVPSRHGSRTPACGTPSTAERRASAGRSRA